MGGPHAALDRSIAAANALRFLLLRDAACGTNVTVSVASKKEDSISPPMFRAPSCDSLSDRCSLAIFQGLLDGPLQSRLVDVAREIGSAATAAAATAAEGAGAGGGSEEESGLERVLGLQALGEVTTRLLEFTTGGGETEVRGDDISE